VGGSPVCGSRGSADRTPAADPALPGGSSLVNCQTECAGRQGAGGWKDGRIGRSGGWELGRLGCWEAGSWGGRNDGMLSLGGWEARGVGMLGG
jgi:hypothetical protein